MEIHSYGETAANLRELLIPFLAQLNFAEAPRSAQASPAYLASEFRRADGDRVFVLGGPNCLLVGYFSRRHPQSAPALSPGDRARRFAAQLKDFLASLPTTRPRSRDTLWSWKSWCRP